jgi:hypothetical protein
MTKTVRWITGLVGAFVLLMLIGVVKELHLSGFPRIIIIGAIIAGIFALSAWIKTDGKK